MKIARAGIGAIFATIVTPADVFQSILNCYHLVVDPLLQSA